MNITALENFLQKHRVKLHGKAFRRPLASFRWDANWMGGGNPVMCYGTELLDWLLWCLLKSCNNPLIGKGSVLLGMRAIKQTEQEHADSWGSPCGVFVSLKTSAQHEVNMNTRVIAIHGGCWRETVPLTSGSELWWENSFKGSRQMAVCLPDGFRNIHLHLLRLP